MEPFVWILVYIAILVALSLTVRWLLLRSERRRASRGGKPTDSRGESRKNAKDD